MICVKFCQNSIVLLAAIQRPTHLMKEKLNHFKKMHGVSKMYLQQDVGKNILYSGKENEAFVSTKKRLYENQKYKNISRLIPDTHSTDKHLKRVDLQTFIWRHCTENIIEYPDPIVRGWQPSTEGLCPFWYSCEQLPPSITDESQNIKTGIIMFHK